MMSCADGIDELDQRFPIRHSLPPSCFWEMAHLRPDRPALAGLLARARMAEAIQQETFVAAVPVPYPQLAEETLTREFARQGGYQP